MSELPRTAGNMWLRPNRTINAQSNCHTNMEYLDNECSISETEQAYVEYLKKSENITTLNSSMKKRSLFASNLNLCSHEIKSLDDGLKHTFECVENICLICAKLLDESRLTSYTNIHSDCSSSSGKKLLDLLKAIVNVNDLRFGSHLCESCDKLLQQVERYYLQYETACDRIRDLFTRGQTLLENDLLQKDVETHIDYSFLDTNNVLIKVLDLSTEEWNVEGNFGIIDKLDANTAKTYRGSIITLSSLNTKQVTGSLGLSELCRPVIFLDTTEFESTPKTISSNESYVNILNSDFDRYVVGLNGFLVISYRSTSSSRAIVSSNLASLYKNVCGKKRYVCNDCSSGFTLLSELCYHVNLSYCKGVDRSLEKNENSCLNTNLEPSLERPFQCNSCKKCFSQYINLSNHVEHYHGKYRSCNVGDCKQNMPSIQEFVLHHAGHANPALEIRDKQKTRIKCSVCKISFQGVWKYFEHSYLHDSLPRFKCPVCSKRIHKVQNFRVHLRRHRGQFFKNKTCPICNVRFFPQDIYRHMRLVHSENSKGLNLCIECDFSFNTLKELKDHASTTHTFVGQKQVLAVKDSLRSQPPESTYKNSDACFDTDKI